MQQRSCKHWTPREVEKELKGATGDKEVALQQRLATQEQQKLLLMQQQSGATGWANRQVLHQNRSAR
jgi:hypothetical protein